MEMLSTVLTNKIVVKLGYISMPDFYLVVCHCYRVSDTVIRIISARKATKTETSQYYEY